MYESAQEAAQDASSELEIARKESAATIHQLNDDNPTLLESSRAMKEELAATNITIGERDNTIDKQLKDHYASLL